MANWYRETERLIARYWYTKERIARLETVEAIIMDSLKDLYAELGAAKDMPQFTAAYGILPPSARSEDEDYSNFVAEVEKQVDLLSKEIFRQRKHLTSIRYRLKRARGQVAHMDVAMMFLTQEERDITEYRYIYKWSYYTIGQQIAKSSSNVRYTHGKIIRKVAEQLGKIGGREDK